MRLADKQLSVRDKLNALPFDQKKWLVRYLFQDVKIQLFPIKKEDAFRRTPPDENCKWYGYFFGQGKTDGVWLSLEGYLDPHKIINLLESLEENHSGLKLYSPDYRR